MTDEKRFFRTDGRAAGLSKVSVQVVEKADMALSLR
jgi:hypothetical protein